MPAGDNPSRRPRDAVAHLEPPQAYALEQQLHALVSQLNSGPGARSFGSCQSCKHVRRDPHGYKCALMGALLPPNSLTEVCREHKTADSHRGDGAFDRPVEAHERNQRRGRNHHPSAVAGIVAEPTYGGECAGHDGELTQFDAEVESEQRRQEFAARQSEFGENPSEPEPVQ